MSPPVRDPGRVRPAGEREDVSITAHAEEQHSHRGHHRHAELVMHLEPDQLVAETLRPVPRARLSRRVRIGLWALRVFAVAVSLMVLYTFIAQLH